MLLLCVNKYMLRGHSVSAEGYLDDAVEVQLALLHCLHCHTHVISVWQQQVLQEGLSGCSLMTPLLLSPSW